MQKIFNLLLIYQQIYILLVSIIPHIITLLLLMPNLYLLSCFTSQKKTLFNGQSCLDIQRSTLILQILQAISKFIRTGTTSILLDIHTDGIKLVLDELGGLQSLIW